jgi:hypothetical protein
MTLTTFRPARRLLVAVGAAAGLVAAPLSAPLAATAAGSANGVYRTAAGTSYDGAGIPPDIRRPVFTPAELNGGRDSAFSTAVEYLRRQS